MRKSISVVINTLNEGSVIRRAIRSASWADEVVVCDMHSDDKTVEIAKKAGARVVEHERKAYVELARNFNISQASHEWVLILDPDEEVPSVLAKKLKEIIESSEEISFVEVPRKNIIFGKWMKASMWWPDYNIRFFKKGFVKWSDQIHYPPETKGAGYKLPAEEDLAIIHHHYESISQFLKRMDRYTTAQADALQREDYRFIWQDLIRKPVGEFLGRFFANRGFEDGLHGFALALLQAFSFLVVYLKLWEREKFKEQELKWSELRDIKKRSGKEIEYWIKYGNLSKNPAKRLLQRVKNKII